MRRSGQTTRRVDDYIQRLFINLGKKMIITDHHPTLNAAKHLVAILQHRIASEHQEMKLEVSCNDGVYYATLTSPNNPNQ